MPAPRTWTGSSPTCCGCRSSTARRCIAQPVRFGDLARRVIDDMGAELAGRDIEFVIADFPPWQVDQGLMQQVFVNLISNAVKFTRERAKARIEIGYRKDGSTLVCFVKDNGVGFNMKYMNKLFGVFQRLH